MNKINQNFVSINSTKGLNYDVNSITFSPSDTTLLLTYKDENFEIIEIGNQLNGSQFSGITANNYYIQDYVVDWVCDANERKINLDIHYILDLNRIGNDIKNGVLNTVNRTGIIKYLENTVHSNNKIINPVDLIKPCKYELNLVKKKLYSYQERNIEWMNTIENRSFINVILNNYVKLTDNLYYITGFTKFMKELQETKVELYGGGLFDEMGCGKTACAVAFTTKKLLPYNDIENRKIIDGRIFSRANLVIVPSHIVLQWETEIRKFNVSSNKNLQIIFITGIVDYQNNTYDDYINSDFVIVSHAVFENKNFINDLDKLLKYYYAHGFEKRSAAYSFQNVDIFATEHGAIIHNTPQFYQFHWNRIIIDEFQELICDPRWRFITNIKATYKWLLSGTPFSNINNCAAIIEYLTSHRITNLNIINELKIFRRNTMKSVAKETLLDKFKVNEQIVWIDFTIQERYIYQSQLHLDLLFVRQFCCSPFNTEFGYKCKTFDEIIDMLRKKNNDEIRQTINSREAYIKNIAELNNNIRRLAEAAPPPPPPPPFVIGQIVNQFDGPAVPVAAPAGPLNGNERLLAQANRTLRDNQTQLAILEKKLNEARSIEEYHKNLEKVIKNTEEVECSICLCDIEQMTITKCGHLFCSECISLVANKKCPTCQKGYTMKDLVIVNNEKYKEPEAELSEIESKINKSGSKIKAIIKWVIQTLKTPDNNIIIFMEWESVMHSIKEILGSIGIPSEVCMGSKGRRQNAINNFNAPTGRIIMLCSAYASHGTNLTKANKIAIINPISGTPKYREDIENQAIARAKRIGQSRDIDVVRFVIKNSIEEDIYNKSFDVNAPTHNVLTIE